MALCAAVSASRRRTASALTASLPAALRAPRPTLRCEDPAPWTELSMSSLAPSEWLSALQMAHSSLQITRRSYEQHCGQHLNFENGVRVRGRALVPPLLLCPRTPLSNTMASSTPDGACRHQQQSSSFKTGQPLKDRAFATTAFQLTDPAGPAAPRCFSTMDRPPPSSLLLKPTSTGERSRVCLFIWVFVCFA